ncbi:hypothetical protein ACU4GH_01840 [Bradyrhizobium betae]
MRFQALIGATLLAGTAVAAAQVPRDIYIRQYDFQIPRGGRSVTVDCLSSAMYLIGYEFAYTRGVAGPVSWEQTDKAKSKWTIRLGSGAKGPVDYSVKIFCINETLKSIMDANEVSIEKE